MNLALELKDIEKQIKKLEELYPKTHTKLRSYLDLIEAKIKIRNLLS